MTCQQWCNDHHTGSNPDDTWCRRTIDGDYGSLGLTLDSAGQPMVDAYEVELDEFPIDEAETYFRAGLALITAARQAVAA